MWKDLKKFKYRYNTSSLEDFMKIYNLILNKYFNEIITSEGRIFSFYKEDYIITWIPIFILNRIFRWYNHTYKISEIISKNNWIPFRKLLIKVKITKRQSRLDKKERMDNIERCFKFDKKYENQRSSPCKFKGWRHF